MEYTFERLSSARFTQMCVDYMRLHKKLSFSDFASADGLDFISTYTGRSQLNNNAPEWNGYHLLQRLFLEQGRESSFVRFVESEMAAWENLNSKRSELKHRRPKYLCVATNIELTKTARLKLDQIMLRYTGTELAGWTFIDRSVFAEAFDESPDLRRIYGAQIVTETMLQYADWWLKGTSNRIIDTLT